MDRKPYQVLRIPEIEVIEMQSIQNAWVNAIQKRAAQRIGLLASALTIARSVEKEGILAELEIRRWIAESCSECLENDLQ